MPDKAILQYVKSIDERTGRIETAFTTVLTEMKKDIDSLKDSRTAARAGLAALILGSTGGAAKLGLLDKFISMFGGTSS